MTLTTPLVSIRSLLGGGGGSRVEVVLGSLDPKPFCNDNNNNKKNKKPQQETIITIIIIVAVMYLLFLLWFPLD